MKSNQDISKIKDPMITNNNVYIANNQWLGYISIGENQLTLGFMVGGETTLEKNNRVFFDIPVGIIYFDYKTGKYDFDNMVYVRMPQFSTSGGVNAENTTKIHIPNCDDIISYFSVCSTTHYERKNSTLQMAFFNRKNNYKNVTYGYRLWDVMDLLGQIKKCKAALHESPSPMKDYNVICAKSILSLLFPFGIGELFFEGHLIYRHAIACIDIKPAGQGNSANSASLVHTYFFVCVIC